MGTAVFLCSFSAPGKADVIGKKQQQITIMTYQDILQGTTIEQGSRSAADFSNSVGTNGDRLAVRVDPSNPDHHLWNNRGTWWCHFTLHRADYTARRVRVSLKTRDQQEARARRDKLLSAIA